MTGNIKPELGVRTQSNIVFLIVMIVTHTARCTLHLGATKCSYILNLHLCETWSRSFSWEQQTG